MLCSQGEGGGGGGGEGGEGGGVRGITLKECTHFMSQVGA